MDRKKILFGLKVFVAISLVTQLGIFFYTSYNSVGFSLNFPLHEMNYYMMGIALCLSWIEGPISGLRIYFIMKVINPRIKMLTSVKAAYANIFLGAVTPSQTGGGVAQIYFISKDKIPISQASGGAVAQRADGLDVAGRSAQHHLGLVADREHLFLALDGRDGDHRGFVEHDTATLDVDQGVGRAEIDGHVGREKPEQLRKHVPSLDTVTEITHARRPPLLIIPPAPRRLQADSALGAVLSRFTSSLFNAFT